MNIKNNLILKKNSGVALVTVIFVILILLPTILWLLPFVDTQVRLAQKEKQLKLASQMANDFIVDYMRQFSQNYYEGHYDIDSLSRPQSFYEHGFSSVTVIPDSQNHTVYIEARGAYVNNKNEVLADKKVSALVKFISDMTDYGTYINGTFTISASNITYYGKWWITGDLSITGSNVTFRGGPLIVGGKISGGSGGRVYGNLYYGGSSKGNVTVYGNTYNFYPSDMVYPTIKENFYVMNSNYKITTDSTLKFEAYPSSSAFRIVGTTITFPIIEAGTIILGQNVNLTVYGTIRGRVTVVTTNTSSSKGKITVGLSNQVANLVYYNSLTGGTTTYSYYGNSFAAIASNGITFQGKTTSTTSDLIVCGAFFDRSASNMSADGASGRRFYLYGSRNKPINISGFDQIELYYDPYLNNSPPPGLPERPVLVNLKIK
jgi:hypothetical protein